MAIRDKVELVYKNDVTQSYLYSAGVKYIFEEILKAFEDGRLVEVEPRSEENLSLADLMARMDTLMDNLDEMSQILERNCQTSQMADFRKAEIR